MFEPVRCLMKMKEKTTMRKLDLLALPLFAVAIAASCVGAENFKPEKIIALERAALDRWGNGDPQGYLETYAPDVTYFDPEEQARVDGLGPIKELYFPISAKSKITNMKITAPTANVLGPSARLS